MKASKCVEKWKQTQDRSEDESERVHVKEREGGGGPKGEEDVYTDHLHEQHWNKAIYGNSNSGTLHPQTTYAQKAEGFDVASMQK